MRLYQNIKWIRQNWKIKLQLLFFSTSSGTTKANKTRKKTAQSSYQAFLSLHYQQVSWFHDWEYNFRFIASCFKYLAKRRENTSKMYSKCMSKLVVCNFWWVLYNYHKCCYMLNTSVHVGEFLFHSHPICLYTKHTVVYSSSLPSTDWSKGMKDKAKSLKLHLLNLLKHPTNLSNVFPVHDWYSDSQHTS